MRNDEWLVVRRAGVDPRGHRLDVHRTNAGGCRASSRHELGALTLHEFEERTVRRIVGGGEPIAAARGRPMRGERGVARVGRVARSAIALHDRLDLRERHAPDASGAEQHRYQERTRPHCGERGQKERPWTDLCRALRPRHGRSLNVFVLGTSPDRSTWSRKNRSAYRREVSCLSRVR